MATATRRAAVACALLVIASAGCVGFLAGNGPLSFEASPVSVRNATLSETGFHLQRSRTMSMNRTVSVGGQSRSVRVTNRLRVYARRANPDSEVPGVEGAPTGGMVVLVSTPKASVAGQGLNPLGSAPIEQVLTLVPGLLPETGDARRVEQVGSTPVTMLGTQTALRTFRVTATGNGASATSSMAFARVGHGDDYVLVLAVFPPGFDPGDDLSRLVGGVEHETAESNGSSG